MPEFEIFEFLALIFLLIPFIFGYHIAKKRRDLLVLFPGALLILVSFTCTNLEAFFAPNIFDFIEHLSIMLGGFLFLFGMVYRYRHYHENYD